MRWAATLGIAVSTLVILGGAGVTVVSWQSATTLVHPARETLAATPAIAFESVSFRADGLELAGWWIPADEPRGTVVFLHGYGDSKDQSLPLVPFLHEAGYHLLAFDFRAHGESEGARTTVGLDEVADVRAAIAYAQSRAPAASERLALVGYSMGAAAAINAAALSPEVDAIVSDSAFATLTNIASNSITAFTDLPKYPFGPLSVVFAGWMDERDVAENRPVEAAAKGRAPILVIQGLDDTIAYPEDDGRAIAEAAPAGSELWLVPGARHVESHTIAPTEYEARGLAFLEEPLR